MPRKAKKGQNKLKTYKATSKRFRLTGSRKLMRTKGGYSHVAPAHVQALEAFVSRDDPGQRKRHNQARQRIDAEGPGQPRNGDSD